MFCLVHELDTIPSLIYGKKVFFARPLLFVPSKPRMKFLLLLPGPRGFHPSLIDSLGNFYIFTVHRGLGSNPGWAI